MAAAQDSEAAGSVRKGVTMGAGFALTGVLLVLTLAAAAVLRWSSRRGHAMTLATAAVAATVIVAALGSGDWRETFVAEPEVSPSAAAPVPEDAAATATPAAVETEVFWLTAEGDEVRAAIPWPEDLGGTVVAEGVPTPVGMDAESLALFYEELGLLAGDGSAFVVQTRAGWAAHVELTGGMVTITFE